MLKYLLALLTLQSINATNFTKEIDYTLKYEFENLGFKVFMSLFKMNSDTECITCLNLYSGYIADDDNQINGATVRSYNQNYIFSLQNTEGCTNITPDCEISMQICDVATSQCIAKQSIQYDNNTKVFSAGFFKPTIPNAIIKSSVENELVIQNKFGMNNSSDA